MISQKAPRATGPIAKMRSEGFPDASINAFSLLMSNPRDKGSGRASPWANNACRTGLGERRKSSFNPAQL